MAIKVGIYDQPQVQAQQPPSAGLSVQVPNFGAALGQGLQDVSSVLEQEARKISQKRLEDFDNKITAFDLQTRAQVLKLKGQAAFAPGADGESPLQPFTVARDKFVEDITKDMTPQQQALAKQIAAKHGVRVEADWMAHQDREQQEWSKSVSLNGAQTQAEVALANYANPEAYNEALSKMGYHLQEAHPGVEISAVVADKKSKVALEALRSMVSANVVVTPENSAHLMATLVPGDKQKADELVKHANAANLAIKASIDFLPANPSYELVQTIADNLYTTEGTPYYNNAAAHKELLALGHQKATAGKQATEQFDHEKFGDISYRVAMGQLSTSAARSELAALTGQMSKAGQGHAAVWLLNFDKANKEKDEELYPAFVGFVTSDAFPSLTRQELMASLSGFGKLAPQVFTAWKQAQDEGGKFAIPPAVKASVITTLEKVDGFKKKNEEDMGRLNDAVLQATEDLRVKGKGIYKDRQPTPSEMAEAVLLRARKRQVSPGFLGMFGTKESLSKMSPDQERAVVKEIPANDKKLIETHLRAKGVADRSTATILAAKDEIDQMRVGAKAAYTALWNRAFPTVASPAPIEEGM